MLKTITDGDKSIRLEHETMVFDQLMVVRIAYNINDQNISILFILLQTTLRTV